MRGDSLRLINVNKAEARNVLLSSASCYTLRRGKLPDLKLRFGELIWKSSHKFFHPNLLSSFTDYRRVARFWSERDFTDYRIRYRKFIYEKFAVRCSEGDFRLRLSATVNLNGCLRVNEFENLMKSSTVIRWIISKGIPRWSLKLIAVNPVT